MPITVDEVAVGALAESLDISDSTARAALLLDEVLPGWAHNIDLDALRIWSVNFCILGQQIGVHPFLTGYYNYDSVLHLVGDSLPAPAEIMDAEKYNFSHSQGDWVTLINARRALVGA